jgi:LPXTG-motif cell wall-anchored protein
MRFVLHFVFQPCWAFRNLPKTGLSESGRGPPLLGFGLSIAGLVLALVMIVINLVNGRPALITGAADMLLAAIRKAPSPVWSKIVAGGLEGSTSW